MSNSDSAVAFVIGMAFVLCGAVYALWTLAAMAVYGTVTYLYYEEEGDKSSSSSSSSFPVEEYIVDAAMAAKEGAHRHHYFRPDFLYPPLSSSSSSLSSSPPPPRRVVEFYAPWCPHCQRFKPKYVDVARKVSAEHPDVRFHAVSCVAHPGLCKDQNVTGFPTIKAYLEGSYEGRIVKHFPDASKVPHDLIRRLGLEKEKEKEKDAVGDDEGSKGKGSGGSVVGVDKLHDKIRPAISFESFSAEDARSDAALSFDFALRNGIYVHNGPLSKKERSAFKEWLSLLSDTLPSEMARTRGRVSVLLGDFDRAAGGQNEMTKLLQEKSGGGDKHEFPSKTWRTCTNGDNGMGYTCGLWQLFHIMSVGVVQHNRDHPAIPIPTRHASEALRNYVEYFFQCEVCRANFLQMYDDCAFDGCHRLTSNADDKHKLTEDHWRQLPLWLWETHNDVNVRLYRERIDQEGGKQLTEDEVRRSRWPPASQCPHCWREDGSWEEDRVYDHLHRSYWSGTMTPSAIHGRADTGVASPEETTAGVSGKNVSWIALSAIIAALAAVVCGRRRRKHLKGRHKKMEDNGKITGQRRGHQNGRGRASPRNI